MFLGYARGKVGDVVFYRQNGEQLARARNRNPRNPNSVQQRYARAIVATVSLAYSAGSRIFNHSFQGRSVGQENQRRFMQLNMERLRTQLAAELADTSVLTGQRGMLFVKPKATYPVANLYRVSEGSMPMRFFSLKPAEQGAAGGELFYPLALNASETVEEFGLRTGLVPGDIYTFVFFADSATDDIPAENQIFGFVRFVVSDVFQGEQTPIAQWTFSDIFTTAESFGVASSSNIFTLPFAPIEEEGKIISTTGRADIDTLLTLFDDNYAPLSMAVIRSAYDNEDRSTSDMIWCRSRNHGHLTSAEVPAAWAAATPIGDPELILEGAKL